MRNVRGKINGRCGRRRRSSRDREVELGLSVPVTIVDGDRAVAELRRGIALGWWRLWLDFQREVEEESRGLMGKGLKGVRALLGRSNRRPFPFTERERESNRGR
jgi:hypothetical protein